MFIWNNLIKKISFSRLIFSIFFSISIFLMSKIVFEGMVGNYNYIEDFLITDLIILIVYIPITYIVLYGIEKIYNHFKDRVIMEKEYEKKKIFTIITFILLLFIFLIYFFTFYPGGVYIDTNTSLRALEGREKFTTQQPVFYTFSLNIVKAFEPDIYTGYAVYCVIQIVLMAFALSYFVYWLLSKRVHPYVASVVVTFFGFFKLIPLYSVSIWKDTPFSIVLLMLVIVNVDLIINIVNKRIQLKNIIKFIAFSLLTMFFRSNGIYIIMMDLIFLLILSIYKKTETVKVIITIAIILILNFGYKSLISVMEIVNDKETMFIESIAIPLQQISRVVSEDGNISAEQKELIEKVLSLESIKKDYRALIVDPIKWDGNFNKEYLTSHKKEYLELWFELLKQNPDSYFKAFLLETSGFWTFNVHGQEAYHSAITWETLNSTILNKNLIAENTNFDLRSNLLAVGEYSGGFFFWIMAISFFLTFRMSEKKYLIGYIPIFALWATVMIATPMGQALRYVYILVLSVPFNILYPFISSKMSTKKLI